MNFQGVLFDKVVLPADIVYTPEYVTKDIIQRLNPKGMILDPCKGEGAFYDHLRIGSEYC
jgi:hypothetical protein